MGRDAAEGFGAAADDGPWRSWCRFLQGVSCHLGGEPRRARDLLEDAVERAGRLAPGVHAMSLAQLALLLLDEDEPVRALMLARRSRAVVEEWGLGDQASASLPYSALALALALSDHAEEARDNVREAMRLLSGTLDGCAWRAVEVRAAVARAALAIGDDDVAREALSGAEGFLGRLADAPHLRDEVERLRRRVGPVPEGDAACLSSITAAEARVLRLLPTHHSIREIADLLFLSRFTVKSHAHSVYRKLGSRAAATRSSGRGSPGSSRRRERTAHRPFRAMPPAPRRREAPPHGLLHPRPRGSSVDARAAADAHGPTRRRRPPPALWRSPAGMC